MGIPKLWGKDNGGTQGFVFSHVKTIYYNWASKILLSTKLDAMDELITQNAEAIAERLVTNEALSQALSSYVTKAMMSGQQVNDANKVPTSALAYAMAQNITTNKNNITKLNSNLAVKRFEGTGKTNADLRTFLQGCVNGQTIRIFDGSGSLNGTAGNYLGVVTKVNNVEMIAILANHWTGISHSISVTDTGLIWKKYVTA